MGNCFSGDDTQPEAEEKGFAPVGGDDAGATETASSATALATVGQSRSSSVVDPKVAAVVDFIRRLYERRKEVIPAGGDEVAELLHNIRRLEEKAEPPGRRVVVLKRSRSLLTGREVDLAGDDLRLQRFKVKTFNAGEPPPPPKLGGVSK